MMKKLYLPEKSRIASFDVDCQYTFTPSFPDELPVPDALSIVDELNRQATFAQYRIGSKDAHSPSAIWLANDENPQFSKVEGEHVDIRWVSHAMIGTAGFELIEGLPSVTEYDFFVWKGIEPTMHPYGACYHDLTDRLSTGVIEFLHVKGVSTVLVGGLATDYCVKTTVLQLLKAGFTVIVNLAASRGIAKETIDAALYEMKKAGARVIDSTAELEPYTEIL
jgi:nicotinamidase/pyrazinamidase